VILRGFLFAHAKAAALKGHRDGVLLQDIARKIGDGKAQVRAHPDAQCGGAETFKVLGDCNMSGASAGQNSPRSVFHGVPKRVKPDT
jgi:hypothetical protein